jgi:prepilin-type N-terminal cleavage/methylation domain-containing protein
MKKSNAKSWRNGFSLIELIMIILIIGILMSTALPRLFATRDDARLAADVSNMAECITEAGALYTAQGIDMRPGMSEACDAVKCFDITYPKNGDNMTVSLNPNGEDYCDRVEKIGSHLAKTYRFRGSRVSLD